MVSTGAIRVSLAFALFLCLAVALASPAEAAFTSVQRNAATPQTPQTTVTVPFTSAQVAGDSNVIAVAWFDTTTHVTSVTDTNGNNYVLVAGPSSQAVAGTQSIYYASGISAAGAGANQVTVTFDGAAPYPDIRIAEYGGIDPASPIDKVAVGTGSSATSTTSSLTTSNANDLLFATNYVSTSTSRPGSGYTQRMITQDGSIIEDRTVTAVGSYSASATLNASGGWVIHLIAFRGAGGGSGGPDTQPPTAPSGLGATVVSTTQINLAWTASSDNVGVTSYLVERCQGSGCSSFAQVGTSTTTSFNSTGLTAATLYRFRVRATDAAGNLSAYSAVVNATTQSATDTQAPTAPGSLVASTVSTSQINLGWTASSDNVGVTSYLVESCQGSSCTAFAQVGTSTTTSFSSTGLTAATAYRFRVRATDAAGNKSAYSGIATATTQSVADTSPPSTPGTPSAVPSSSSQVDLTWAPSTDNVGVTNYLIERCQGAGCTAFAQVGASATTSFSSGGLAPSTTYLYRVRASDAAGNLSAYSGTATATTPAGGTSPPGAYIQGSSATPQTPQSTVSVTYSLPQNAGNFNLVAVAWYDTTTHVVSVTDSSGNAYTLAAGPTTQAVAGTQSIYYAQNIVAAAAGANTVKVTFDAAAPYPDIRIVEYGGIDPTSPIDRVAAGSGTGATSMTGAATTTNASDLLVATNYVSTSTSGPGVSFTKRFITPDGSIVEDRVVSASGNYTASAALTNGGGWVIHLLALRLANSAGSNPNPPQITLTSPSSGASLTGSVTLSANVTAGGNPIGGVQFQIDGVNVGTWDTVAPYTMTFNTARFGNGSHTVSAFAWDSARNIGTSSGVSVTFSNASPANPATAGMWSDLFSWPMVTVHGNMLPDGRVLFVDGQSFGPQTKVWDPLTGSFIETPVSDNVFCGGNAPLPDGRIFFAGGHVDAHVGLPVANIFDPQLNGWVSAPNMSYTRWYPTTTELADGRILVTSGETTCDGCLEPIPEVYNPSTNTFTKLTSASLTIPFYPHMFLIPDGRVVATGTAEGPIPTQALDVSTQTWSMIDPTPVDGGSSVMYLPGKILKSGLSVDPDDPVRASVATSYVLDMTQQAPGWRQVGSMGEPRDYHTLTVLPDGTVLAAGGGRTSGPIDLANAAHTAEIWNPATETWTTLASNQAPRLYHSIGLLLPDARVLVSGGGRYFGAPDATDQLTAEIFAPPYLFKGPRPTIAAAPAQLQYGQPFTITSPDAARIAKVSLVKLGNVTHAFDEDQRFVPVAFTASTSSLTATAPATGNLAPPGYYMLFIVDTNGVPSVAAMVHF